MSRPTNFLYVVNKLPQRDSDKLNFKPNIQRRKRDWGGGALFILFNYKEIVAGFYRCIYVILFFKIRILFTVSPSIQ